MEEETSMQEKICEHDSGMSDSEDLCIQMLSSMAVSVQEPVEYKGTGIVYDELMLKHKNEWDNYFPERPERIIKPFERCQELGLISRCHRVEAEYATEDMILLQHTSDLLEKVKSTCLMNIDELKEFSQQYDSIYCNQATYECALKALGSVLALMVEILRKNVTNGLAIVRPPGHHAMTDQLCGYCVFNNVAIAAKYAVEHFQRKRVLIVDWDVHHGQATQQMFYEDQRVLYISIHRYENGSYWPRLRESDYDYIGNGEGLGFNINIPLNKTGMTDSDYLAIFHQVVLPVSYQFCPEIVLVSAGYDCAVGDFKGEMMVSPAAFGHMTHQLMLLANGQLCVCLEGGYCITSLSESVALTLKVLLGDQCQEIHPLEEPSDSVSESILNVIKVLRPYWSCFQYQDVTDVKSVPSSKFIEKNRPNTFPLACTSPVEVEEIQQRQKIMEPVLQDLISQTKLTVPPYRTCLVYDDSMGLHKTDACYHAENAETMILQKLVELGLLKRCLRTESRPATETELQLVHSSDYIDEVKECKGKTLTELKDLGEKFKSCQETYDYALSAAGSLLNVVDAVLNGTATSGMAVLRPPRHQAEYSACIGFCFLNTIAMAAKYAQQKFGLKRILILDWDVHHGYHTQQQFYEDNSVLVISLHRYDNGTFSPESLDGSKDKIGEGRGLGFNVNIDWNLGKMGDAEYIASFTQIIMPIAYQFAPELVLVSAGFDSAVGDPLGGYMLSPTGYAHLTHMLSSLAGGKVVLGLEGGYNLESVSLAICMCTSVLLGDSCPSLKISSPLDSAIKTIKDVINVQSHYWKCLKFKDGTEDII